MRALIAVLAILGVVCVCPASADLQDGRTITVDDDGAADFSTIQAAIDDSNDGDTVLVADGTYTGAGNRDIDFNGKAITVKSENGPETCIIDCNGTRDHMHRGFYFHSGEGRLSAVIGFSITNGYAPPECLLPRPPFYCDFLGGGIYCKESNPAISHCIITGNRAHKGGGIYYEECSPRVSNCTIAGNYAADWGGGMAVNSSIPEISNCIIRSNRAPNGLQIYIGGSGPDTVAYSDVEGGWPGPGNIDADPCFADSGYWDTNGTPEDANDDFWVDGDYHLKSQGGRWNSMEERWTTDDVTSLCIDAGDPMTPIGPEPFPNGGRINMGAYGGTAEASKSYFGAAPCEVIVAGDVNGDCCIDYSDFAILAAHWLECATPEPEPYEDYFPLSVGNSWTYADFYDGSTKTFTIIGTEEINGHTYYKFDDYFRVCCFPGYEGYPPEDNNILFRYDPDSDRVLQFWPSMNQDVVRYDFSGDEFGEGAGHQLIESGITQEVPAGTFSDCCEFGFAMNLWCGYFREILAPDVGNIEFITNGADFILQSYAIYPSGD